MFEADPIIGDTSPNHWGDVDTGDGGGNEHEHASDVWSSEDWAFIEVDEKDLLPEALSVEVARLKSLSMSSRHALMRRSRSRANIALPHAPNLAHDTFEFVESQPWTKIQGLRDIDSYLRTKSLAHLAKEVDENEAWHDIRIVDATGLSEKVNRNELKFLIRKGVPDSRRRIVWQAVCGVAWEMVQDTDIYTNAFTTTFGTVERLPRPFSVPSFGSHVVLRLRSVDQAMSPGTSPDSGPLSSASSASPTHERRALSMSTGSPTRQAPPVRTGQRSASAMSGLARSNSPPLVPSTRLALMADMQHPADTAFAGHHLTERGRAAANRVLCVLSCQHPHISFCPQLVDLVLLSLHFLNEEETYVMAVHLLKRSGTNVKDAFHAWLSVGKESHSLFLLTFGSLMTKKLPKLQAHMDNLGLRVERVTNGWFSRLFVGHLPFQTVLRIFDAFVNEGCKILYRVGLGLFQMFRAHLLATKTPTDFTNTLKHLMATCNDEDMLMKLGFAMQLQRKKFRAMQRRNRSQLATIRINEADEHHVYYRPKLSGERASVIVTEDMLEVLWGYLPRRFRIQDAVVLFSTGADGYALSTLYASVLAEATATGSRRSSLGTSAGSSAVDALKVGTHRPCIVLVRTKEGAVFGAFASHAPRVHPTYYGSGECFVFSLLPQHGFWAWARLNSRTESPGAVAPDGGGGGGGAASVWFPGDDGDSSSIGAHSVSPLKRSRTALSASSGETAGRPSAGVQAKSLGSGTRNQLTRSSRSRSRPDRPKCNVLTTSSNARSSSSSSSSSNVNSYFIHGTTTALEFGSGPNGAALRLDDELCLGSTCASHTFDNDPLDGVGSDHFEIDHVEVIGFV